MSLSEKMRKSARDLKLAGLLRVAKIDTMERLGGPQLSDIRMISAGFRAVNRKPADTDALYHTAENLGSRAQSILSSRLVAICAYYLCAELLSACQEARMPVPDAIGSLAFRCDRMTNGRDLTRFALLVAILDGNFRQVNPDVGEAVAAAVGSCVARLRVSASPGVDAAGRCYALAASLYMTSEQGRREVTRRLAAQLADDAPSDGYRLIAEYFHSRADENGTHHDFLRQHMALKASAARLDQDDPGRELAQLLTTKEDGLVNMFGPDTPAAWHNLSAGMREMGAGNFERAVELLDLAADAIDDPVQEAAAAFFSFASSVNIFKESRTFPCDGVKSALQKLTAHRFAAFRDYLDGDSYLRLTLNYCASRADDLDYAWLAARVADMLGEYSAGAAIGGRRASGRAGDAATRELAITDLLTGMVCLPPADTLRAVSRTRTLVWVNLLTIQNEPVILTLILGPRDERPQLAVATIRSSEGHQLLDDAVSARLTNSGDQIRTLRRWIFQQEIDTSYPVMVIADRKLWSLPWTAIVPEPVAEVTVMPSAAAAGRLRERRPSSIPIVAGVFDLRIEGAKAELTVLEELHQEGKVRLRRAASLTELMRIAASEDIDLLTIATHGTSGDGFEYRLMFPDAPASPAGLLGMRLPSHVVLGCCWSARQGQRADSIATAVACLSAGASSVVGALWAVSDETAGRILTAAYRDFAAGQSLSGAIRSALLNLPEDWHVSGAALAVLGLP